MGLANNAIRLRELQANIISDHAIFNNAIRLRELQANIIGDHAIFNNVHQVSVNTGTHLENISGSNETTLSSAF